MNKTMKVAVMEGIGKMGYLERMQFYEEAKNAYAIVATTEPALYANIMLQKGVIK